MIRSDEPLDLDAMIPRMRRYGWKSRTHNNGLNAMAEHFDRSVDEILPFLVAGGMPPHNQSCAYDDYGAVNHRLRRGLLAATAILPLPEPIRRAILAQNRREADESRLNRIPDLGKPSPW
ncbi:MAG: hypothetical protein JO122_08700 [Acetobacteraceae bacterium]|nr:hypothetical protein [Acetobacteraceae bacterium]